MIEHKVGKLRQPGACLRKLMSVSWMAIMRQLREKGFESLKHEI
jgi:hypothetical protein